MTRTRRTTRTPRTTSTTSSSESSVGACELRPRKGATRRRSVGAPGLENPEGIKAFRLLELNLDAIDASPAWAFVTGGDEVFDCAQVAFEDRFHRSVAGVANPARDSGSDRMSPHGVAEEHALDESVDDYSAPDHAAMVAARETYALRLRATTSRYS